MLKWRCWPIPTFVANPVQILVRLADSRADIQAAINGIQQSAVNDPTDQALRAALAIINDARQPRDTASTCCCPLTPP
jgi:hypothetical protein